MIAQRRKPAATAYGSATFAAHLAEREARAYRFTKRRASAKMVSCTVFVCGDPFLCMICSCRMRTLGRDVVMAAVECIARDGDSRACGRSAGFLLDAFVMHS